MVEAQHKTPGNLRGLVQAKIRNLKSGAIIEHRFRSVDMVERAILDETEMEFLYQDGDMYHFMNNETFEQMGLSDEVLGDAVPYLIPNIKLKIEMYEGRPVGIELPLTVEMKVMETEPAIKGASVSNQNKPAKMETGLVVNVPPVHLRGRRDPHRHRDRRLHRARALLGMNPVARPSSGWVEVITGSMFSGKSEELIRRIRRAADRAAEGPDLQAPDRRPLRAGPHRQPLRHEDAVPGRGSAPPRSWSCWTRPPRSWGSTRASSSTPRSSRWRTTWRTAACG